MKTRDVIDILTAAIPNSDTWSKGEPYGAFNVDPEAEIEKILFCVTATEEVKTYFLKNNYDLLISHHPYKTDVPQLIFHTALDCCKGGLNDMWSEAVGIQNAQHFDRNLGWYGKIAPISLHDLCQKIELFTERKILGQACSKKKLIESVAVCSGLGGMVVHSALKTDVDCYIIGEATWNAKTSGFNAVIETGHTNSEWIGIRLIQKLLPSSLVIDLAPSTLDLFGGEIYRHLSIITR